MPRITGKSLKSVSYRLLLFVTMLALAFGGQSTVTLNAFAAPIQAPLAAANISTLHLSVISANDSSDISAAYGIAKGDPITQFKYIINIDNTGTTVQRNPDPGSGCSTADAGYPDTCAWLSIAGAKGNSPIYTQGNQDDFVNGVLTYNSQPVNLPAGRYLISVLADNYKIDGEHFTVPSATGDVTVQMQPYDLPTATVQASVFEDMAPTNSAPDLPAERGLAGFVGHVKDYIDEVTTDVFGAPLCGNSHCVSACYVVANGIDIGTVAPLDADGRCPIAFDPADDPLLSAAITDTLEGTPIPIGAVVEGKVIIPNLGPNRYALSVVPPNGSGWVQTTTLEGNHDWDAWVMEGATGLDTEFVVGGEPLPATFFGYAKTGTTMAAGAGVIKGLAIAVSAYIPPTGGITGELGLLGAKPKDKNPIHDLYVSLSDLNQSDQTVYTGHFQCDESNGCPPIPFEIANVPDGDYFIGLWDEPQDYIFQVQNVSVRNGEMTDIGAISMLGWWTTIDGHVFNDLNENGRMDAGEPGIPNYPIVMRKRENSLMDRGTVALTTDADGYYWMESAYPMTQWLVQEAYADGFQTTGITYQADNQPQETTIRGQGVDVNVHPVIGLGGRLDWGVKAYAPGTNGGIVGTVSYDTTRNELNPQYAAIEDWQPSISNLTVDLFAPVDCPYDDIHPCDENGFYQLEPDGSYSKGPLLNQYLTETWERPSGCVARNVNGEPLIHGVDENVLPLAADAPCIESPMMGMQFGPMASDVGTPDENFGASVDGNYGFGDGCFGPGGFNPASVALNSDADPNNDIATCMDGSEPTSLPSNRDFLVKVNIPTEADIFGVDAAHPDRPLYQVTREEDINIANGDSFVPQVPPPACAGPLHTVDVAGIGTGDGYGPVTITDPSGFGPATITVPASTPTNNPTFVDIGGTVYEGLQKPLCDTKLVRLSDRKSIAPGFNLFTDVPLPGRFWGLLVDDLNFSSNPKSQGYGEKQGIAFAPVGVYDYTNRLITTVESDYNGLFDVLLPSTNRISCPTPSGVCANLYRLVGNDPGIPGRWNANYNIQYRTISAEFEAFPGLIVPADLAPTQMAAAVQIPGMQTLTSISCMLEPTQPQLFAVSKPYADISAGPATFTIDGTGFGGAGGQVLLDGSPLPTTSWSDGHIDVTVPSGSPIGVHQLSVKAGNGMSTVNGLGFNVISGPFLAPSAFPSNASVLDNFNNRNSLGGNWGQNGGGFAVVNNSGTANDYLRIQSGAGISNAWWSAGSAFGASQEAYFTFAQVSGRPAANEQGLLLKYSGGTDPDSGNARWVEVALDNNNTTDPEDNTIRIRTKSGVGPLANQITELLNFESPQSVFSNGDILGARAMNDGTIIVYKNGSEIVRVASLTGLLTGRIGVRFEGTGSSASIEARIDNFGGGNVTLVMNAGNLPSLFEVGPGHPFSNIQSAIDAAAAQNPYKDSLVVVYPGVISDNPRYNGRGAYYENPIMYAPVKLQGVGPGGIRSDNSIVQGSIIDGSAFAGDTTQATNWLGKISTLTWDGNQDINDGQVIYVLASDTGSSTIDRAGSFGSAYKASIDGFDIRGGDQQGLPGNLTAIFGGFPGPLPALQVVTQGGAIFANSYARNLQITNNVIESNSGSYGAIRIGTPNLPDDPNTPVNESDNQNNDLRIANNRILANGGTNLAGAIGLFNGAGNYEIAGNDLCANFSAEYGGAISHFGLSPNGRIHDNRIYFNHSYDEGAGIMIAGELPADPTANYGESNGPQGSGSVDIYNNLLQANLSEDDGGGVRFLMAGNFPMNVYNNMIVNNVSTHEGGGVAIDDAPNVRFYNNTVMKNITTATAITSNGLPAPAGLSTGQNSLALQNTLVGSPSFSDPMLFNNIFWDNRAGTRGVNTVLGIGSVGANQWDLGVTSGPGLLSPTNSVIQQNAGIHPYTTSPTNSAVDPVVVAVHDIPLTFTSWRTNVNFIGAIMVTADLPPTLMGDYHLGGTTSPAYNLGASSKGAVPAPGFDIDNDGRPAFGGFDSGADEIPATIDISITKTDGVTSVVAGSPMTYTIVVTNSGPNAATAAPVTDVFPSSLTVVSWTCAATAGSSCTATGSGNNRGGAANLDVGGSATYTASVTLSSSASGLLSNTASVVAPVGLTDTNTADNSATDTDSITPALPAMNSLDTFTRPNATTLGANWSQIVLSGSAAIRVNSNQAFANTAGQAFWNGSTNNFGSRQGAAFTFSNATLGNSALTLKASGGTAAIRANFIRVRYTAGVVYVETTTTAGLTYTSIGSIAATFASGDRLTAVANVDGSVDVWQNSTYLGRVTGTTFIAGGRIGMQLPAGARVDDFSGGTLP